jgi:GT2 family glycosyltransferase
MVYVLILNWNGWRNTLECLESVFRSTCDQFRVIVCDNGSEDDSVRQIERWAEGSLALEVPEASSFRNLLLPPVRKPIRSRELGEAEIARGAGAEGEQAPLVIIRNSANHGFAGGNNVGLRYALARADCSHVWLLNNDTVVDPGSMAAMADFMEANPGTGAVGSKVLYYDRPTVIQTLAGGRLVAWLAWVKQFGWKDEDGGRHDAAVALDYITGASLFVKRETLITVGLISNDYFMYAEDIDWCMRIRRQGFGLGYCARSVVWHKEGATSGYRSPFADYYSTRNVLMVVRRFHPRCTLPAFCSSIGVKVFRRLVRRQFRNLPCVLRAHRDFLKGRTGKLPATQNDGR